MAYDVNEVPIVNPSFAFSGLGRGRIAATVNGEIKVIQCSEKVLGDAIAAVDGTRTFGRIEDALAGRYPRSGVRGFLSVLADEDFLLMPQLQDATPVQVSVLVVGDGRLADAFIDVASTRPQLRASRCRLDAIEAGLGADTTFVVLAPESMTYGQLIDINRMLVGRGVPFIGFAYSGKTLVVGPLVSPGITACFECRIRHHLSRVNENLDRKSRLTPDDLSLLPYAMTTPDGYSSTLLCHCAASVCDEIASFFAQEKLSYANAELTYARDESEPPLRITYCPVTECESCHGGVKERLTASEVAAVRPSAGLPYTGSPICYRRGGLRSVTPEETKELIDGAFARAGLRVDIRRLATSPLHEILPCYRATFAASRANATPYAFGGVVSRGKGMTEQQAYLSAAFEMAERISAQFCGASAVVTASYDDVSDCAIDVGNVAKTMANPHTEYDIFDPSTPIDWVWARSLVSGESLLVPASMVFLEGPRFRGQFMGINSSGLSAGATLEDAILQGLLEVVEHDAWMMGQANPVVLPEVDSSTSENEPLRECIMTLRATGRKVVCRDYTNDLGIPVIRSWVIDPRNYSHYALSGFGASLSAEIALERSITEAVLSDDEVARRTDYGKPSTLALASGFDSLYALSYFQAKDIVGMSKFGRKGMGDFACFGGETVQEAIEAVTMCLRAKMPGCDVLYVDLTKDVLGVPVVRILVTGDVQRLNYPLISVSPRTLAFRRAMGYSDAPCDVTDLYLGPYPH